MNGETAILHFNEFVDFLKSKYDPEKVLTGAFGQKMEVDLVNDGPVTLVLE